MVSREETIGEYKINYSLRNKGKGTTQINIYYVVDENGDFVTDHEILTDIESKLIKMEVSKIFNL